MKKLLISFLIIAGINDLNAQNGELLSVFEKSYTLEYNLEYGKAIASFESVYSKYQSNFETNLRLGWLHYLAGNFKDADKYYSKAVELKPLALEAIYGNILPLLAQGKYNEVLILSNKALSIAPNDSRAEYYIGVVSYYQKDYTKSERFLEKAINKYPFDVDINLMLGWTKFALGKKNEAKVLFQVAQRHSPNSVAVKTALDAINK
ncbi:MAG: tetratricopeptide repeat protein [Flavobacteriaceae bacterium]|nr:tetratricopeptide repeat protein [Flavobacteriaceae bacterium]